MSSEATICFTARRAVGRWMRRAGLHPHGEYVASLVIDLCDREFDRCADVADSDGFHCG